MKLSAVCFKYFWNKLSDFLKQPIKLALNVHTAPLYVQVTDSADWDILVNRIGIEPSGTMTDSVHIYYIYEFCTLIS